jgi:SecD/SecF fusion protein
MFFAAATTAEPPSSLVSYLVMFVGIASAILFVAYFASGTDRRKRATGTLLSLLLVGFSVFCISQGVKKGIDLAGGASFLVRVQPDGENAVDPGALVKAQEIIEGRLNPDGAKDVAVTPQGADRLYIEVPGLSDEAIANSKSIIERTAKLEFRLLGPNGYEVSSTPDEEIRPGQTRLPYLGNRKTPKPGETIKPEDQPKEFIWVKNSTLMSGESVRDAFPMLLPGAINYTISVGLHGEYGDKMTEITTANRGNLMAIILDGKVLSAPQIKEVFGKNFQISGQFNETEAFDLANALKNPLRNPLVVEQSSIISATYGKATVDQGIKSALVGLALTLLFMMIYYRLSGVVAVIGLVVNLLLLIGAMQVFGFTLTMPSIAGIILTLGMAVDANVLIYERMREEFQQGKNLSTAITASYEKAFTAIFDSNITTLITSLIMMFIATGAIRGFGLSLTIGLIASMFSALLITRVCFLWLSGAGLQKLSFLSLIENRLYDFMGKRKIWLTVSLFACLACIAIVAMKGQRALGYELRGGDQVSLKGVAATEADVIKSLEDWSHTSAEGAVSNLANVTIGTVSPLGDASYLNLRSTPGTADSLKAELIKDIAGSNAETAAAIKVASTETMGPAVGNEMLSKSFWAIGLGLVGIFIYLTFRFEMAFAVGGIIAILHDVIIAVGVCALCGKEISLILIGAFLTIAGYSINDTIVIFDRVRENLRTMKGDLEDVLNHSISATLSRTIITSGVTALAVLAMYLFGGKAMADFSFAMLIGMISGTYSTIFIASPVVLWWANRRKVNLRQQILDADLAKEEAETGIEREAPHSARDGDGDGSGRPALPQS